MILTYKFNYYPKDIFLHEQCKISKNLYNQTLYIVKQELNSNQKWLRNFTLDAILKKSINLEGEINYRLLKAQVAQQVIKQVDISISGYFKTLKDFKKNPKKYKGQPRFPKYLQKSNILQIPNQSCSIKNNKIYLNRNYFIDIPQADKYNFKKFKQVRIIPKNNYFEIEIIYNEDIINSNLNLNKFSSIDLGLDNLATLVATGIRPCIINGKIIKAYNQFYNKQKARLISIKDKMGIKKYTKKLNLLEDNRKAFIKDFLHKTSKLIINILIKNKIATLVVGLNKQWKDSINLGKRTNQTFVNIPHSQLINYLKYKCEKVGIKFFTTEESYTSKCSALDLEEIKKQEKYLGKRIKRGIFVSSMNKAINADVNGALNILRKVVGDFLSKEIINSGLLFNPIKIRNLFSIDSDSLLKNLNSFKTI
jgi:putative transposase